MKVERWDPDRHLETLGTWLRGHAMATSAGSSDYYPPTGFVVDDCAVGFIYRTNARLVGYMDGIVTDPMVGKKRRYLALDTLCQELLRDAELHGVKLLFAITNHVGLLSICRRQGFATYGDGFTCLVKDPGAK